MTRPRLVAAIGSTLMALLAAPLAAQDHAPPEAPVRLELTPYVSLGSAQSSLFGTAITVPWTQVLAVEGEVGYRRGEVSGLTADLSLLHSRPRTHRFAPYLAAGVGLREYGSALAAPDGSLFTRSKVTTVLNAGGGIAVAVDSRWSVRTDLRWFNGLGPDAPEHWRLFTGVTMRVRATARSARRP